MTDGPCWLGSPLLSINPRSNRLWLGDICSTLSLSLLVMGQTEELTLWERTVGGQEDGGGTGGRWRDGRLTHTNRPHHIKVFEVCLVSLMHKTAAFACRAAPDGSSQNTHFKLHSRFTFASIHPSVWSTSSSSSSNTPGHNFNNKG